MIRVVQAETNQTRQKVSRIQEDKRKRKEQPQVQTFKIIHQARKKVQINTQLLGNKGLANLSRKE